MNHQPYLKRNADKTNRFCDDSPYSSTKETAITAIPAANGMIRPSRVVSHVAVNAPVDLAGPIRPRESCARRGFGSTSPVSHYRDRYNRVFPKLYESLRDINHTIARVTESAGTGRAGMKIAASVPTVAVAPMMERTDRHCRYLLRLISPKTRLYTEMITAAALVHGARMHLLEFHPGEHPVALQLGGSDPGELARAAALGAAEGYDEINLNVGCPSDRVQSGRFGAALMAEPQRVAACLRAMMDAVDVPVTVKTRTGIDDLDSYEFLHRFVGAVADAGCREVIIHARKAILSGLSPKQNRQVPPLDYDRVYRLKADYPAMQVILNGGLDSQAKVMEQSGRVDGVMLGRYAYSNPWVLAELDGALGRRRGVPGRDAALRGYVHYVGGELQRGTSFKAMTRHLAGLFAGRPGARAWRRFLSELPPGEAGHAMLRRRADAQATAPAVAANG